MREQCLKVAKEGGVEFVADETHGPRDADVTPQLTKIKNTPGIQALVHTGFGQHGAVVTRNVRQIGMQIPFYQNHGVASKSYIELSGDAANGVRLPAAALLLAEKLADNDPQKPVVVAYKQMYEKTTGQPVSTFGGHAYDGFHILVEAMKRANSTDPQKINAEIEKTKGFIGTAGIVNMSPTDHLGLDLSAFKMLEIRNGDWVEVKAGS
jgi:branched-chain amino acid transport system substrate-binding protein